jgi:hypothetical protein
MTKEEKKIVASFYEELLLDKHTLICLEIIPKYID